jgi:hypothetical protein
VQDERNEREEKQQVNESTRDVDYQTEHPQGNEEKTNDGEHKRVVLTLLRAPADVRV